MFTAEIIGLPFMFVGDKRILFIGGHTADRIYVRFCLLLFPVLMIMDWCCHGITSSWKRQHVAEKLFLI